MCDVDYFVSQSQIMQFFPASKNDMHHVLYVFIELSIQGVTNIYIYIYAVTWQNQQNDVRPAKAQISLSIHPVRLVFTLRSVSSYKGPMFLDTDNEDWSDWADAQADLSLRRAHRSLF